MYKNPIEPPPLHFPEGTWEQLVTLLAKQKPKRTMELMELEDEYDPDIL